MSLYHPSRHFWDRNGWKSGPSIVIWECGRWKYDHGQIWSRADINRNWNTFFECLLPKDAKAIRLRRWKYKLSLLPLFSVMNIKRKFICSILIFRANHHWKQFSETMIDHGISWLIMVFHDWSFFPLVMVGQLSLPFFFQMSCANWSCFTSFKWSIMISHDA